MFSGYGKKYIQGAEVIKVLLHTGSKPKVKTNIGKNKYMVVDIVYSYSNAFSVLLLETVDLVLRGGT